MTTLTNAFRFQDFSLETGNDFNAKNSVFREIIFSKFFYQFLVKRVLLFFLETHSRPAFLQNTPTYLPKSLVFFQLGKKKNFQFFSLHKKQKFYAHNKNAQLRWITLPRFRKKIVGLFQKGIGFPPVITYS